MNSDNRIHSTDIEVLRYTRRKVFSNQVDFKEWNASFNDTRNFLYAIHYKLNDCEYKIILSLPKFTLYTKSVWTTQDWEFSTHYFKKIIAEILNNNKKILKYRV